MNDEPLETTIGEREEFTLERFASDEDLYIRMEQIRDSNPTEACGFLERDPQQIRFYYKIGDTISSVHFPTGLKNSWHSHPNTSLSEIQFDEADLPEEVPLKTRHLAKKLVDAYKSIDEISAHKISLMDLINIASHGRDEDLISLPGHILRIHSSRYNENSHYYSYIVSLKEYWNTLTNQAQLEVTYENFLEIKMAMDLQYLLFAISEFEKLLKKIGIEKMTTENFLNVLDGLDIPYTYRPIPPTPPLTPSQ